MECPVCCLDLLSNTPTSGSNGPPAKKTKLSVNTPSENVCLPCGHVFHRKCINDWFAKQYPNWNNFGTCPTCRKQVSVGQFYPIYFPSVPTTGSSSKSSTSSNSTSFAKPLFPSSPIISSFSPPSISSNQPAPKQSSGQTGSDVELQLKLLQEDFEELRKKLMSETERADFNQALAASLLPPLNGSETNAKTSKANNTEPINANADTSGLNEENTTWSRAREVIAEESDDDDSDEEVINHDQDAHEEKAVQARQRK